MKGEVVSWETAREAPKGLEAVTRLGSTFKLLDPPPEEEDQIGKAPGTAGDEVSGRRDGVEKAKDASGTAIPFPDETASKPLGGGRTRENPKEDGPTGRAPGIADDEGSGRDSAGKGGVPGSIVVCALGFGRSRAKRKPERFRPRPDLTSRPKQFLVARPKTTFKPLTSLLHVRIIERSKFEFERGGGFLPSKRPVFNQRIMWATHRRAQDLLSMSRRWEGIKSTRLLRRSPQPRMKFPHQGQLIHSRGRN
jgi:hypothetical protein